jgi:hypothetical protein
MDLRKRANERVRVQGQGQDRRSKERTIQDCPHEATEGPTTLKTWRTST